MVKPLGAVPGWHANLSRECRFETPPIGLSVGDRLSGGGARSLAIKQSEAGGARTGHTSKEDACLRLQQIDYRTDNRSDLARRSLEIVTTLDGS